MDQEVLVLVHPFSEPEVLAIEGRGHGPIADCQRDMVQRHQSIIPGRDEQPRRTTGVRAPVPFARDAKHLARERRLQRLRPNIARPDGARHPSSGAKTSMTLPSRPFTRAER